MGKINKSYGSTPSERFLSALAHRSFLSLWSYPNVFRDKAKELCDLLVVCGDHVLVFSDKSIGWRDDLSCELGWSRWYRSAIAKSAAQLHRAIRWIEAHPDRLYLNAQCTEKFPIELPSPKEMKIHGIIVARGASKACRLHFGSGSGSLGLMPSIGRTKNVQDVPSMPFFVGNPSPSDDRVYHILDDTTLPILLTELDTITDFTNYLIKRENLIKQDQLMAAHGEEDLLSLYMKDVNELGEHDFVASSRKSLSENDMIFVEGGSYANLRKRGEYKRKKAADRISYVWDNLIESFAKNIIADTSYIVRGYADYHSPSTRELGLRHMALVPRLERRSHGMAIKGAFEAIGSRDRFFRAMLPGSSYKDRSTGFFVLLVKRNTILKDKSDEDYRRFRANLSLGYAMNLLRHLPHLERVVGIATEGELKSDLRSEDIIYAEQPQWTDGLIAEVQEMATGMEIFKNGLPSEKTTSEIRPFEYPPSHHTKSGGYHPPYQYHPEFSAGQNRKERRAKMSKMRKSGRP